MPLQIKEFSLGQLQNNTFVIFDESSKQAMIVDPSFQNQPILDFVKETSLAVESILCTHGHFDHFAGVALTAESLTPRPQILLNEKDLALWEGGGGSKQFNFLIKLPPRPDQFITHGQVLQLGKEQLQIREVPGHSPGSVILYIPTLKTAICGDAIFRESIGRTDLEDGDHELLLTSIREQIFTLPDETVLLPGHGAHTTVAHEKRFNPYLKD
jgi:glyoxylase-like metal-dependent hydrolase (beta-lactamase superfamily II)